MRIFETPKNGTYKYNAYRYERGLEPCEVRVKILRETQRSYQIQFAMPTHNHKQGDTAWVKKNRITIDLKDKDKVDTSVFWYNNLD